MPARVAGNDGKREAAVRASDDQSSGVSRRPGRVRLDAGLQAMGHADGIDRGSRSLVQKLADLVRCRAEARKRPEADRTQLACGQLPASGVGGTEVWSDEGPVARP